MGSIQRESVLFLTNSEYGQANVHFATAFEFLERDEFDVHFASYPSIGPRVEELNDLIQSHRQKTSGNAASQTKAVFHALGGVCMVDNIKEKNLIWPHKTGISNVTRAFKEMAKMVIRDDHHNYLRDYDDIVALIKDLKPTVAVIDPMLYSAIDACNETDLKYVILSPMTFYELAAGVQPRAQLFWKYPATGSGYAYPVPWYQILPNIWLMIQLIIKFIFSPSSKSLTAARLAHGIKAALPLGPQPGTVHICPSLPEIDYPMEFMPPIIHGVGPILLPNDPVSSTDPALANWLHQNPTILINLGSHHINSPSSALEMASALTTLLSSNPSLQILWKLKTPPTPAFTSLVAPFIDTDRLRITPWIIPETSSILACASVIAFVHHGGANSFFEACYAGVPHVVLPPWFDCYQNATKVEYLRIGVYANKRDAPEVQRGEFLSALKRAVGDGEMYAKARELGVVCRRSVGRAGAREVIVSLARGEEEGKMGDGEKALNGQNGKQIVNGEKTVVANGGKMVNGAKKKKTENGVKKNR